MRILQPTKQKNISPRTPMKNGPRISRRLTKRGLTSLATGGQMVKLMSICRLAVSIWAKEKSAARQESRLVCFFVTQVARDVCLVYSVPSPVQSDYWKTLLLYNDIPRRKVKDSIFLSLFYRLLFQLLLFFSISCFTGSFLSFPSYLQMRWRWINTDWMCIQQTWLESFTVDLSIVFKILLVLFSLLFFYADRTSTNFQLKLSACQS